MDCDLERIAPLYPVDEILVGHLLRRFDAALSVASVSPLLEGAVNSNYLVRAAWGCLSAGFLLRIFAHGSTSWVLEAGLRSLLAGTVPMQQLYFVAQDDRIEGRTFALYGFVEGVSLQTAIRSGHVPGSALMAALAETLAAIHSHTYPSHGSLGSHLELTTALPPLASWYGMFLGGNARGRLGPDLARRVEETVQRSADLLQQIEARCTLVHGDCRPANIIVSRGELKCVVDWEFAMAGHPIADIGQLFRVAADFHPDAVTAFAACYSHASGLELPVHWRNLARLRDLANLVQMMDADGDMPARYAHLAHLIAETVRELGGAKHYGHVRAVTHWKKEGER